jgi:hypothetical protein
MAKMAHSTYGPSRCLKAIAALLLLGVTAPAQPARVEISDGAFKLTPWMGGNAAPAAGWESVFSVYAGAGETPMLGTYSVEGDALVFHPRFPLVPGMAYHGRFGGGRFFMDPPRQPAAAPARVEHVYPSTNVLPANALRLYIYFSAPMSQGGTLRNIHLLDETGKEIRDAFLDQELWDPDNRRLTVLFDPGRIKRGLASTDPPIVAGRRYTLTIDRIVEHFEKAFAGGPADRTPPAPKSWRVIAPKAGTVEPLVVEFPKPMDYALLQRMLEVPGVPGDVALDRDETRWRLTPRAPWKRGLYRLEAQNKLEDISGNHLDRAFDVDIPSTRPPRQAARSISLPFRVH